MPRSGHQHERKEMMVDETELSDILSGVPRTMLRDSKMQGILDQFVRRVADFLPITSAGVSLSWTDGDPELMAASSPSALEFGLLQSVLGEGPVSSPAGPVTWWRYRISNRIGNFPAFIVGQ